MEIRPFRAFRFDESVVGDAGSCIAPPYDVISAAEQQHLYEKSQYNIVRIIKGKTSPSDNQNNNQYTRAADCFKSWIEKGALKQDSTDSIYAYVQDFELAGRQLQRLSFVAQAKLEPFGETVRPHEETLDEPITDRLKLKRATLAEFGLPFMLYEDPEKVIDKIIQKAAEQNPLLDHTDEQNIRHRLFAITARQNIEEIVKMMSDKSCIIADGHHRYTTALAFAKDSTSPAVKYQMLTFANIHQQGLVILPTHRLVKNTENLEPERLISRLKNNFEITEHKFDSPQSKTQAMQRMLAQIKAAHNSNRNAFGIYCGTDSFCTAVLKDEKVMHSAAPQKSDAYRSLDVSVLQTLVLEQLLGIDEERLAAGGGLEYIQGSPGTTKKLISQVDTKDKQAAFFMNPVSVEQLKAVTAIGERMAQKTTHFYPKVYSGLTVDKL